VRIVPPLMHTLVLDFSPVAKEGMKNLVADIQNIPSVTSARYYSSVYIYTPCCYVFAARGPRIDLLSCVSDPYLNEPGDSKIDSEDEERSVVYKRCESVCHGQRPSYYHGLHSIVNHTVV
jgi:hypothetical protein